MPNSKFHPTYLIFTLFFIVFLHGQSDVDLQIEVIEVEYIDAETQEITYLDATTSVDATLKLSRDYNHVYVALKKDPSIQYAYKVTGEAGLLNWKNTNSELHLVGLSRGAHRLYIR